MGEETEILKRRAPTLYLIIAIKILKGLIFVALAVIIYCLSDNDLPREYRHWLQVLRLNPERKFWSDLANIDSGQPAIFEGLSKTAKTLFAADPKNVAAEVAIETSQIRKAKMPNATR